jgi:hypothetical protein
LIAAVTASKHGAVGVGRVDVSQVLRDRPAGDRHGVAVQQPRIQQGLHDHRDAAP